jgi:hypothetical protein
MARIRSIKPEIAQDKKLADLPADVRWTFLLCISQADDFGLLHGRPRALLGVLYPVTESVSEAQLTKWIDRLVSAGLLERLTSIDGMSLLHITTWEKHQPPKAKRFHSVLSRALGPSLSVSGTLLSLESVRILSESIAERVRIESGGKAA